MSENRRKGIVRHLSEDDFNRLLAETDDEKVSKRLTFVKNLYKGDTLKEAADRVGKSASTGSRWARRWNKGGLGLLTPNNKSFLNSCVKDSPGKNRRYSI